MFKYFLYDWAGYNNIISQFIHSNISYKPLVCFAKFITQIGNFYFFPLHFLLLLSVFFIVLRVEKNKAVYIGVSYAKCIFLLILNVMIGVIVFKTMKHFFDYPRPYCVAEFSIKGYLLHLFGYSKTACNHSFPSGHTAYVSLFIVSFWSILNRNLKILGVLIMFLVGISRVILAKHFIADVAYSYLIVLAIINPLNNCLVDKYFPRYKPLVNKFLKKYL